MFQCPTCILNMEFLFRSKEHKNFFLLKYKYYTHISPDTIPGKDENTTVSATCCKFKK